MSIAHRFKDKVRTEDVLISESVDFSGLLLSNHVLQGLTEAGFKRPSPIQLKAIPLGRCGLDLIVQAKSGTGKTCVFTVVALESLELESVCVQALVLAPTREIAIQIQGVIQTVGRAMNGLKCHTFIGGLPVQVDKSVAKSCHIAVGTPGRIKQLIDIGALKTSSIRLFVLDEADKLLEGEFQEDINWIYSSLPDNKQILALSATYTELMAQHLTAYMRNPTFVRLNVTDPALLGIKQYHVVVPNHPMPNIVFSSKTEAIVKILSSVSFQQCLIFSNLQTRALNLQSELQSRNWPTACIAGYLDQKERNLAMEELKTYKCRILISTDLTSRGIDADKVNLVINLDVPPDHETYLHRIGRAGRFGSFGAAVSIVSEGGQDAELWAVERKCGTYIHKLPDPIPNDLVSRALPARINDVVSIQVMNQPATDKEAVLEEVPAADTSSHSPKIISSSSKQQLHSGRLMTHKSGNLNIIETTSTEEEQIDVLNADLPCSADMPVSGTETPVAGAITNGLGGLSVDEPCSADMSVSGTETPVVGAITNGLGGLSVDEPCSADMSVCGTETPVVGAITNGLGGLSLDVAGGLPHGDRQKCYTQDTEVSTDDPGVGAPAHRGTPNGCQHLERCVVENTAKAVDLCKGLALSQSDEHASDSNVNPDPGHLLSAHTESALWDGQVSLRAHSKQFKASNSQSNKKDETLLGEVESLMMAADPESSSTRGGYLKDSHLPATTNESGKPTTNESGKPTTNESGRPTTNESGRPTTDESGKPTTDESGKPTTDESGKPTTNESGKPTTNESGKPTTNEPGKPTTNEKLTCKTRSRRSTRPFYLTDFLHSMNEDLGLLKSTRIGHHHDVEESSIGDHVAAGFATGTLNCVDQIPSGDRSSSKSADIVADRASCESVDIVADRSSCESADIVADISSCESADIVADRASCESADIVADRSSCESADIVADRSSCESADIVADRASCESADIVADRASCESADIVADRASCESADIVADRASCESADIVADRASCESADLKAGGDFLDASHNVSTLQPSGDDCPDLKDCNKCAISSQLKPLGAGDCHRPGVSRGSCVFSSSCSPSGQISVHGSLNLTEGNGSLCGLSVCSEEHHHSHLLADTTITSVNQSTINETPETVNQSTINETPETVNQSTINETPETVNQSTINATPETVNQSTINATPETVNQPTINATPETVNQPTINSTPETVNQSNINTTPETVNQPTINATPETVNQPTISATPETVNQSNINTTPETVADLLPSSMHKDLKPRKTLSTYLSCLLLQEQGHGEHFRWQDLEKDCVHFCQDWDQTQSSSCQSELMNNFKAEDFVDSKDLQSLCAFEATKLVALKSRFKEKLLEADKNRFEAEDKYRQRGDVQRNKLSHGSLEGRNAGEGALLANGPAGQRRQESKVKSATAARGSLNWSSQAREHNYHPREDYKKHGSHRKEAQNQRHHQKKNSFSESQEQNNLDTNFHCERASKAMTGQEQALQKHYQNDRLLDDINGSMLENRRNAGKLNRPDQTQFSLSRTHGDRADHTRPDHTRPDHTRPDRADHTRPDRADHIRPDRADHTRPDHTRPDRADHTRPDRADHTRPDHTRPDRADHTRPDRADHTRPDRADHTRPDRADHTRPDRADHTRPDRADHTRPDRADHTRPDRADHTRPDRADHTRPDRADHTRPDRADHTRPDRADHTRPDRADHTRPDRADHTRPDRADHTRPDRADHTLPDRKDDECKELDDMHAQMLARRRERKLKGSATSSVNPTLVSDACNLTPELTADRGAGTRFSPVDACNLTPELTADREAGTRFSLDDACNLTPELTADREAGTRFSPDDACNLTPELTADRGTVTSFSPESIHNNGTEPGIMPTDKETHQALEEARNKEDGHPTGQEEPPGSGILPRSPDNQVRFAERKIKCSTLEMEPQDEHRAAEKSKLLQLECLRVSAPKRPSKPSKSEARLAGLEISSGSTSSTSDLSSLSGISDVNLSDLENKDPILASQCYANKYAQEVCGDLKCKHKRHALNTACTRSKHVNTHRPESREDLVPPQGMSSKSSRRPLTLGPPAHKLDQNHRSSRDSTSFGGKHSIEHSQQHTLATQSKAYRPEGEMLGQHREQAHERELSGQHREKAHERELSGQHREKVHKRQRSGQHREKVHERELSGQHRKQGHRSSDCDANAIIYSKIVHKMREQTEDSNSESEGETLSDLQDDRSHCLACGHEACLHFPDQVHPHLHLCPMPWSSPYYTGSQPPKYYGELPTLPHPPAQSYPYPSHMSQYPNPASSHMSQYPNPASSHMSQYPNPASSHMSQYPNPASSHMSQYPNPAFYHSHMSQYHYQQYMSHYQRSIPQTQWDYVSQMTKMMSLLARKPS